MRLARLNLARYGKFTDFVLDFGAKQLEKPDFHIIFGSNEAGKTTALTAILDLLYGISKGSQYGYKHKDAMAVGGFLEFSGGVTREFTRIKKATNSLLDADGHIVPDAAILGDLESLLRADYEMKFSLDADTLKKGGKNILESKGDLGQLLFSASAGVADLSVKLNELHAECEGIYKKRGQKTAIAELKNKLDELAKEKTGLDMLWKSYSKLATERDDFAARYEKAREERKAAQIEQSRLERLVTTAPRLTTLKDIDGKLASLADASDDQPELKPIVEKLKGDELRLEGEMKAAMAAIETLEEELAEILVDEAALGLADKLKALNEFRSRYDTAVEDLPKREAKAEEVAVAIKGLLREIGRKDEKDPVSLQLDASLIVPLRDLVASRGGIEAKLNSAKDEVNDAEAKLKEHGDKLIEAKAKAGVTDPDALKLLGVLVVDVRKGGYEGAARLAAKTVAEKRQALADAMKLLAPWRGGPDDLGALKIPEAGVVAGWTADLDAADEAVKTAKAERSRLEAELVTQRAKRDASAASAGVISDGEAAQKRSDREAAWAEHRRKLDGETADVFEARLRADDVAVNLRFIHASEVAKVNATLEAVCLNERLLEQADTVLKDAEERRQSTRNGVAAAIQVVSGDLPATMTPDDFGTWAEAIEDAVAVRADLLKDESELREANLDRDGARARLGKAMVKAGVAHAADDDLADMLLAADDAIAEATALKTLATTVEEARKQLGKREDKLAEEQRAFDGWTKSWADAVGSCWIGSTHRDPSTALVSEILLKLADLGSKLLTQKELLGRIEAMRDDKIVFNEKIETLAGEIGEVIDGRSAVAVDERLAARAKFADEQNLKRSGKRGDLQKAKAKQVNLAEKIAATFGPKQEVFDRLGVASLAEAERALERAKEKAGLFGRKAEEEGHILTALEKSSMAEAEAILNGLDLATLSDEKAAAEDRFNEASARQQELYAAKAKLDDQLDAFGGDAAVALIDEKRRAIFLEIEEKGRRWLRMRAGIVAAEFAMRNYRDKHRSSMLAKASDAFATITRRAYTGLAAQSDGVGEALFAILADNGGSRRADELSKGTQFQLYLALRIAGYHEYAGLRQPPSGVPFVADDIMETFDNERSEEAFSLLAKMAEVGQVIYLTHHEHLCEIARKVCPEARLHRLP